MRTLAKAATSSLVALCAALVLVVVAVAAIGTLGTRSAAGRGNAIAGEDLTTSVVTGQLARNMDAAYAAGEAAVQATDPAMRSRLLGSLYTSLLPAVDAQLFSLERAHAGDPPAEHAEIDLFIRDWTAVRDLLSPPDLTARPAAALAGRLTAAYQPASAHLDRLILRELDDARADHASASASAARATGLILGVAAGGIVIGVLFLRRGIRRIRRNLEPGQDQAELAETLRGAEPRSCLAVRSGRTHSENGGRPPLLSCSVCASAPGASSCVPLTVGGEVIGSVLLSRPAPYSEAEEQRIRESVTQAAPVLANLRNLAVAEIRAATDGLTGLPNQRAVTDALKRTFAQAATTKAPLALLLLDLDHFKQVNDQGGHAAGDQVLASLGATLRSVLRARDFAGRNGGEEFAVLLPDTEVAVALEIAERIRAAIAEISLPGTDVPVTASIGVAGFPGHASSLERLERLADAALYVAKRRGRNRIELAEPASAEAGTDLPGTGRPGHGRPGTDLPGTDLPATGPAANGSGPASVPAA